MTPSRAIAIPAALTGRLTANAGRARERTLTREVGVGRIRGFRIGQRAVDDLGFPFAGLAFVGTSDRVVFSMPYPEATP